MEINFHALGEEAMLINFDQKIDLAINKQVHALAKHIALAEFPFVKYITPAYCSITIAFNKDQIDFSKLKERIETLTLEQTNSAQEAIRKLFVPVCYHRSFALDMEEVENQTGLSGTKIVEEHTSTTFHVFMTGFLPGFPYLGKLSAKMECRRKAYPRLEVPKGAVGLAGLQTGIYPATSPGGWQIIGSTPVDLTSTNQKQPFLFQAGDEVQFYSISKSKYDLIQKEQKNEMFTWDNVYA